MSKFVTVPTPPARRNRLLSPKHLRHLNAGPELDWETSRIVGANVRALRGQQRLRWVADALRVSRPALSRMERGEHRFRTGDLPVLAELLGVTDERLRERTPA